MKQNPKPKIVITYGTFDILHYGHIRLLERAKALGDRLYVGLSTDEFCAQEKNKRPFYGYDFRKEMLEALRCVDQVFPEETWQQKANDVKKYHTDIVVMGSDWAGSDRFEYLKNICKVKYLSRTPDISTTEIKKRLGKNK
ncbi:adenylyltransferase/cytidyltransferase family protein [Candidatus Saccharibacteria bacterium]|nr:adenylyltransferase/cytidyltransferase family protein [Candidatus Saccharibacteria bacterium]